MTSRFGVILDILKEAFTSPVSERDYYRIVAAVEAYGENRCSREEEQEDLMVRGFPLDYHPCEHMENLRFGMVFCSEDNKKIGELLGLNTF